MKKSQQRLILTAAIAINNTFAIAQTRPTLYDPYVAEPLPTDAPAWMRAIEANPAGVNYYQMDSLFADWIAKDVDARVKTLEKKPAVNFYRRWKRAYRSFVGKDGKIYLPTYQAYADSLDRQNRRYANQTVTRSANGKKWRNIGPNTTQVVKDGMLKLKDSQTCIFRIDIAKTNPNTVYCGTQTGMVFKTTDKGQTWKPCNAMHNFGGPIYALHVSPVNENIVWVGAGQNLWKTTDGGQTWTRQEDVDKRVNSIRISPSNPQFITLATGINDQNGGAFYVSVNGGTSFRETFQGACHDHELQPDNDQRIYLLAKRPEEKKFQFYISEDGGQNFTVQQLPVNNITAGRLAVSQAPGGNNYVYALVNSSTDLYDGGPYGGLGQPYILLSKDAGKTWLNNTTLDGREQTFSGYLDNQRGGQGYFDMIVGASPNNPDYVIFGLCNAYRSEQGGKGYYGKTAIGGYQKPDAMHPDIQDIAIHGNDTWICTDGGVKYSNNFFKTDGEDKNFGLYASEYHGFGQGWNEDVMVGGRWHNGDAVHYFNYGEGNTLHVGGVEWATGHVLLSESRKVYHSDDATRIIPERLDGTAPTQSYAPFRDRKPYESLQTSKEMGFDPRYAKRILINSHIDRDKLYESKDEGMSFHQLYDLDTEEISNYEFARSNPDYIYVAGKFFIYYSTDNGKTWDWIENNPFDNNINTGAGICIAVDPKDEKKLWFTNANFPGRVAYTDDMGKTWQYPLSEEMKNKRFNWIILTGNQHNGVYLGTEEEAHVYYKDDTTNGWIDYSNGLPPAARIARLVPFYKEGKLRAATSQGIWEIPLYEENFAPVAQPMALNLGDGDLSHNPMMEVIFDSYSIAKHEGTEWEWSFSPEPMQVTGKNERKARVVFGKSGSYDVTLKVKTPYGEHSRTIKNMIRINSSTGIESAKSQPTAVIRSVTNGQNATIHIETNNLNETKTFTLHDAKGRLLHTFRMEANTHQAQFHVPNLTPGVYIYELYTKAHQYFGKFIQQ